MKKRSLTVGSLIGGNGKSSELSIATGSNTPPSRYTVPASPSGYILNRKKSRVWQNGIVMDITPIRGQTVLEAALEQQQPIAYKCGKGTCGRCAVRILDETPLTPLTTQEKKTLQEASFAGCRLACQSRFQ